jgi:cell division protein FtsA
MAVTPVVALEIGTAKVRALVGEEREGDYLMITGVGECPARGVRKGEITDFDNALSCVEHALEMAEQQSKVRIHEVHVVVSGSHIQGTLNRATSPIIPADSEITEDHIEQVMEAARAISLPPERQVLHSIHQQFFVDDQEGVTNPEGMVGAKLAVSMLILHGVRNRIKNVLRVASSARVEVADCAFGGLCAALAVLTPEQKESGCVVIDLGAGTTDYVVYANRCIALAGSLGVGGDHITNDLAMVLGIPSAAAEKIKVDLGLPHPDAAPSDEPFTIQPSGGFAGRTVRRADVEAIMRVRMEETLGLVQEELARHQLQQVMGAGVILTGGGTRLRQIEDFAAAEMNMPCSIGRPRNVSGIATATEGPEYAVTIGMLRYGLRSAAREARSGGLFGLLGRWLGR